MNRQEVIALQKKTPPPWYYNILIVLLKPIYRLVVMKRSKDNINYHQELSDRFGNRYVTKPEKSYLQTNANSSINESEITSKNDSPQLTADITNIIWCHAVSLGETNTIAPIVRLLLDDGYKVWFTNTTHTGFARVENLFAHDLAQGRVFHSFVPVDDIKVINNFLQYINPKLALFVETELWANSLYMLAKRQVPSVLINARLSEKSYLQYKKFKSMSSSMMANIGLILAQDSLSARRFEDLEAHPDKIKIVDTLKWTINTSQAFSASDNFQFDDELNNSYFSRVARAIDSRKVWVAASTHPFEEEVVLKAHQKLRCNSKLSDLLLILVPRHPERFAKVSSLLTGLDIKYKSRSKEEVPSLLDAVFFADSMGELSMWYQLANVAFVGGSITNIGGHNPVESLVHGTPVIMGKYTQSCQRLVDELISHSLLKQLKHEYQHVNNTPLNAEVSSVLADELCNEVSDWILSAQLDQINIEAKELVNSKQGTLMNQYSYLLDILEHSE